MWNMRCKSWMVAAGLVLATTATASAADDGLADEIVKALTVETKLENRVNTRSIRDAIGKDQKTRSIERVQGTILVQPGDGAAAAPEIQTAETAAPSYDLYVTFPFASYELTDEAKAKLESLATTLKHPKLANNRIRIAGHTDAVGTEEDNQKLSEARAEAVQKFLWEKHAIDPERIETVGYGKSRLKDPDNPLSGVNRRVELVNMGTITASTQ